MALAWAEKSCFFFCVFSCLKLFFSLCFLVFAKKKWIFSGIFGDFLIFP